MDWLIAPHGSTVLQLVVRVTVLLSAALALAWLTRRGPARVRHLLWTMTFALLLVLPVLSLVAPSPEILRGEIPDSLPASISLHVGTSNRIWVERWPPEGMESSRYYDVLEYDGRYRGTVVVPAPLLADPPPFFGEDVIVGVVMDPTTEVHSVVSLRFRLPR